MRYYGVDCISVADSKERWRPLVNIVIALRVASKTGLRRQYAPPKSSITHYINIDVLCRSSNQQAGDKMAVNGCAYSTDYVKSTFLNFRPLYSTRNTRTRRGFYSSAEKYYTGITKRTVNFPIV